MRQITYYSIAISIFMLVSSCSRMVVNVSTADRDKVLIKANELESMQYALQYAAIKDKFLSNPLLDPQEFERQIDNFLRAEVRSGVTDTAEVPSVKQTLIQNIGGELNTIKQSYIDALNLTFDKKYVEAKKKFFNTILQIEDFKLKLADEFDDYEDEIKKFTSEFILPKTNFIEGQMLEVSKTMEKDNLLGDHLVSYVTKKHKISEKFWESEYNTTKTWTMFGNSDIAVVLAEDPDSYNNNYSIKGIRVDADKLIQSSFDMLAQSINLIASTQGVALPSSSDEDNYFAPDPITSVQELSNKESSLESKRKTLQAYKELLLLEIFGKDLDKKNDDDLKKAINEIKVIWESYKSKIDTN